ncbi:organic cation/carnitine transporter 2 isoform X2 [Gadus macrocephalus]|uniref:organic cation/carnitine transporter 2 isoform X2 n=1 Tax=Gadus macrocephalus TaxID=80720 RepID=UPI0028CB3971|nr:organic cation/carnitine transporter 2 isoform X2 [Gadus macrocephalus]
MPTYEDAVAFLGEWGPYQQLVFFLLCFTFFPNGFTSLCIVFIGDTPSHHCLIPASANLTSVWMNNSIPLEEHVGEWSLSKCSRYNLDALTRFSQSGLIPGIDVNLSNVQQEACLDGWEYDRTNYDSTIVTEWDLVCEDQMKGPLTSSIFFCGVFLGSCISGPISDRFGRKIVMFSALAIHTVFSLCQVLSPSWALFCALFFLVGMGATSNYVSAFVIGMELFNPVVRTVFSTAGSCFFFGFGYMLLPLLAYYIRDWRMLLLTFHAPTVLFALFWWFIPESPRWLLSQGRVEEAEDIIRQAAKKNKMQAPLVVFDGAEFSPEHTKEASVHMWDLLSTRNIRWTTLTLWLVWIDLSITYFVLSLNTSNLHGSIFLNCFLSAALEIPAYALSWGLFRYLPRRLCLSMSLFLGGVMILCIPLIPSDMNFVAIAFEMTGKFGMTLGFALIFAYTAELYPTVLRNTAIGACSMASRIGCISAPYLLSLRSYSVALPYIMVGTFTVLAAMISLLIPETFGKPLPDSIPHMLEFPGCFKKNKLFGITEEEKPPKDPAMKSGII